MSPLPIDHHNALNDFTFTRIPRLYFGVSLSEAIPRIIPADERRILFIHGTSSWKSIGIQSSLEKMCSDHSYDAEFYDMHGEPSPELIDDICRSVRPAPDAVIPIGGGSVLDAGKAAAAMFCEPEGVESYLEGVGSRKPGGGTITVIACPTTAGTGSEATKNAVISKVGPQGYKKSLRHDNYIPAAAVIDPKLACPCPEHITAAAGLDSATQLLEAFTSSNASPLTDQFCEAGISYSVNFLLEAIKNPADRTVRGYLGLSAYYSGIALANAGLGLVHGLASVIGGRFSIPHGVICAKLFIPVFRQMLTHEDSIQFNMKRIRLEEITGISLDEILSRYETIASMLPSLSSRGFIHTEIQEIAEKASNKNALIPLGIPEIEKILMVSIEK